MANYLSTSSAQSIEQLSGNDGLQPFSEQSIKLVDLNKDNHSSLLNAIYDAMKASLECTLFDSKSVSTDLIRFLFHTQTM